MTTMGWWARTVHKEPVEDIVIRLERALGKQEEATSQLRDLLDEVRTGRHDSGSPQRRG